MGSLPVGDLGGVVDDRAALLDREPLRRPAVAARVSTPPARTRFRRVGEPGERAAPDARIRVTEAWAGSGRRMLRAILLDPAPRLDLTVPSTLATGSHEKRSGYLGFDRDSKDHRR